MRNQRILNVSLSPITKQTILIVDDTSMNRFLLADILGDAYNILEATNGVEALSVIQSHGGEISLILLDIVMPEMNGFEVLEAMNERGWIDDFPIIMVSSDNDPASIARAYALGATDFINRPFDSAVVHRRVTNTLMLYAKQKALTVMVKEQICEREQAVNTMIAILSHIVEFRNGESGAHVLHVNRITELLLKKLVEISDEIKLTPKEISTIAMASSLHDIGKISIAEEILNKPGRLTDEEFEVMKTHAPAGAEMLKSLPLYSADPLVKTASEIARWHHERYDGSGYPDGLVGDAIPISAQVVALADVYDALTSERVYKKALPHEKAMAMILGGETGAFNPLLLRCLSEIQEELVNQMQSTNSSVLSNVDQRELQAIVERSMSNYVPAEPSRRTLDMVDYERMKFDFFAMMSNEIQYEFAINPPILTISDHGDVKLGLPEAIYDPYHDQRLIQLFGEENLRTFCKALRSTTIDDPIIQDDLQFVIDGETRWFHCAARAMWVEGENGYEYRGSVGKFVDIHESKERISDLERKATQDSLTGLVNHAFARKIISKRMAEDADQNFVLMIIDMDNFKEINDEHGHLVGDRVLQEFSERMKKSVRGDDVVARIGGDEFLICMECGADVKPLVDRVYNALGGSFKGIPVSFSMGVVCARGGDMEYDELFKRADDSLYKMKRAGRGGYRYAEVIEGNA